MHVEILPTTSDDLDAMAAIFNGHVCRGVATYTDEPVTPDAFASLVPLWPGYPACTARNGFGAVVGFGLLRPYSLIPAFSGTAELTIFLDPACTGLGIGGRLLDMLEANCPAAGITSIIATVSSLNERSILFHLGRGFETAGRLKGIGWKRGRQFDVVLLQKRLPAGGCPSPVQGT